MRLRRLDLVRYGRFTGGCLDFGAPVAGAPDLHVVYGPNEAGKSTALNAWLDLLFGIEAQSGYAFLHPYATMRIGAEVETGGRVLALSRIKGNKGTLLGESDRPVPEAVVLGALGGLDRRALREMFSLDDETLEAGGNSILDSDGEVGQLLFASGAGLAGFAPGLAALRKTPDPFFRAPRSGALTEMKARLATLDADRARLDTDARGYKRLLEARDDARGVLEAAEAGRRAPMAALAGVQRRLAALPSLRALEGVEARLAGMPDLAAPPQGWAAELAALEQARAAGAGRLGALCTALDGLRAERAALVPDPAVLAERGRIGAVAALRSGHDEAVKDLPARRGEAAALALRIAAALDRLGRAGADPAQVLPDRAAVATLRALIEARSGVGQALDTALGEVALARGARDRALADGAGEAGVVGDTAALALLLRRVQDEAPVAAHSRATEAVDAAGLALDQRLRSLLPWAGGGVELAGLVLPGPGVIAGWKAGGAQASEARATAVADLRRLDAGLAGGVVAEVAGGVTLDTVAEARALREAAWAAHRAALDAGSASAFEAAMRRDDAVTARLAETLAEVRRRAEAEVARAVLVQERGLAAGRLAAAEADQQSLDAAMAVALSACGLPPMSPEALEGWMALRRVAVDGWDALGAARKGEARARAAVDAARAGLAAGLAEAGVSVGPDEGLTVLMARAGALCALAAERVAQQQAQRRAVAEVTLREAAEAQARAALAEWQGRWVAALAAAGMAAGHSVDAAREDIAVLEGLAADHRAHVELADRVTKMQANEAGYAVAVGALGSALGMVAEASTRLADAIAARLAQAAATAERVDVLEGKLAVALREAGAQQQALEATEARIGAMVAGFGAADAADLARRLALAAARVQALDEAARLAEALCEALEEPDAGAARAALAGLDRDVLTAERQALDDEVTARGAVSQAAYAALSEAQQRLDGVGGDDAVLHLAEARETLLLEMADEAEAHLARRLGLIAVEHGLRRYRDKHRSAMLDAASAAFRTMTRGAYAGLATQPEGAREVLVALSAGGGSKRAADLSKGTRFQLYLALRVAAYHERAAQGPVPPFVADDIMETFDDDRAAEAFAVMAGMAGVGQVIYLTHHRHLCDIAREVCPQVRLHQL